MTGPLVDASWLAQHLDDPSVRIADVRSLGSSDINRSAYDAGHIRGAIFFDMESDLAGPGGGRHPLPAAAEFTSLLGDRGIGSEHRVVVYDDTAGAAAARMWWMLRSLGHSAVGLLDGGVQAWQEAGFGLVTVEPATAPATFTGAGWRDVVTADELRAQLGAVRLLDARSADRYRGENEILDPVAGHIPTAISTPYADNLDDDGRFRPRRELAELYPSEHDDIVVYCGSGVTACHTLLALEIAGIAGGRLYAGSWSDWITDEGRPQAVGPEPGSP